MYSGYYFAFRRVFTRFLSTWRVASVGFLATRIIAVKIASGDTYAQKHFLHHRCSRSRSGCLKAVGNILVKEEVAPIGKSAVCIRGILKPLTG